MNTAQFRVVHYRPGAHRNLLSFANTQETQTALERYCRIVERYQKGHHKSETLKMTYNAHLVSHHDENLAVRIYDI